MHSIFHPTPVFNVLVVAAFLLVSPARSFAQDVPASARAEATTAGGSIEVGVKLAEVLGIPASVEQDFKASTANIIAQLKKLGDDDLSKSINEMTAKFYDDNYKWEKIGRIYGTAYSRGMTDEEMKAAIAFYETEAGKKLRDKNSAIIKEAEMVLEEFQKNKKLELQRAMIMAVQKSQASKLGK